MNETRIICGCCAGSGQYQPLIGPPEPCGTCKGEKFVPAVEKPKEEKGDYYIPAGWVDDSKKIVAAYGGTPFANSIVQSEKGGPDTNKFAAFFDTARGVPYKPRQSENRIHRKGSITGEIGITFTTKNTNQDAIDNLLRSFYRQLEDLGAKVEGMKASVGQDKVVLHGEDGTIYSTWQHKPRYDVAAFISDEGCPMDFAAIERHFMEKQALMQLEAYKAMTSVSPLIYDPKYGVISYDKPK